MALRLTEEQARKMGILPPESEPPPKPPLRTLDMEEPLPPILPVKEVPRPSSGWFIAFVWVSIGFVLGFMIGLMMQPL